MRLVFSLLSVVVQSLKVLHHTNIPLLSKYIDLLIKKNLEKCPLVGLEIQPLLVKLMYVKRKVSVRNTAT